MSREIPGGEAGAFEKSGTNAGISGTGVSGNLDDGFVPPIFAPDVLDRKTIVRNRESIEWTRRLLDECGVFASDSLGDDANDGTKNKPFKTLAKAIAQANGKPEACR